MFDNGYVEIVFFVDEKIEYWYLFLFSIYYLKNLDSVWVVFDFVVKFYSLFFNDVLMKGIFLYNSLLGILLCNYGMWNKCFIIFMCLKDIGIIYGLYGMKEMVFLNFL